LGRPVEDIQATYANLPPGWYVPIGDIPEATMQEHALSLQPFIGKGLAPPRTRLARIYPQQGVAPHIVGYVAVIPANEETTILPRAIGVMNWWAAPAWSGGARII
jgi:hypothetical protein